MEGYQIMVKQLYEVDDIVDALADTMSMIVSDKLTDDGTGQALISDVLQLFKNTASRAPDIVLCELLASGTAGGTFTSGAYQTRLLNVIAYDPYSLVNSLVAGVANLADGTYFAAFGAEAYRVDGNKTRLQDTNLAATLDLGRSVTADTANNGSSTSSGSTTTPFVLAASPLNTLELQHRCVNTRAGDGFGVACGFGDSEIYSELLLWKVG